MYLTLEHGHSVLAMVAVAAAAIGLPIGDFPFSRPPQAVLPEEARARIRSSYEQAGMAGKARVAAVAATA